MKSISGESGDILSSSPKKALSKLQTVQEANTKAVLHVRLHCACYHVPMHITL